MHRLPSHRRDALAGTLVAAALCLALGAQAQTIYAACYVPKSGTVYRTDEPGLPQGCTDPSHVPFKWVDQGAPGPQGPQGPAGAQGPQGPAGGLSGFEENWTPFFLVPANGAVNYYEAKCSPGKIAVGGGYFINATPNWKEYTVFMALPMNDATYGGVYRVYLTNDNAANTVKVGVVVTCAIKQ